MKLISITIDHCGEFGLRKRGVVDPKGFADDGHVGHILIGLILRQAHLSIALVGGQETVDLGDVDPTEQVRIVGPVQAAVRKYTGHTRVNAPDEVKRIVCLGGRSKDGVAQEVTGSLQAPERVMVVVTVLSHRVHRIGVQRLKEQGAHTTHEDGRVSVHNANRAVLGNCTARFIRANLESRFDTRLSQWNVV